MMLHLNWAVLSDEQMSNEWSFSLLNDEQMSNKVGVEHQPVKSVGGNLVPGDSLLSLVFPVKLGPLETEASFGTGGMGMCHARPLPSSIWWSHIALANPTKHERKRPISDTHVDVENNPESFCQWLIEWYCQTFQQWFAKWFVTSFSLVAH